MAIPFGKWTVQQAADLSVVAPTIASFLDARFLSGLKEERVEAAKVFKAGGFGDILIGQVVDKKHLIDDVRQALYASKICSYAQGMNLIREMSIEKGWDLKLGELARIWKGGCIIRAVFLDWIKKAYDRNPDLANLLGIQSLQKKLLSASLISSLVYCFVNVISIFATINLCCVDFAAVAMLILLLLLCFGLTICRKKLKKSPENVYRFVWFFG